MRIVIAGGGTAGHVVPAVALAEALEGDEVSFVGTASGAESALVPRAGFPLEAIEVRGFDRARPLSIFATGIRAAGAVRSARRILRASRPQVAVGMGGYVSLPVCLAARSLGVPVLIHEQNVVFGLANNIGRHVARSVAVSWEETLPLVGKKGIFTGNPVLRELASADFAREREEGYGHFGLDPARKTLLVFGGSQGARTINDAAAGLASRWRERADLQVLHITGRAHHEEIARRVSDAGDGSLVYRVVDYVDRMAAAYGVADLALCRGGATTAAEISVAGVPAIIVPYPHHRDRQQERHGRILEAAGAAFVLDDGLTSTETVAREALRVLEDDELRAAMAAAAAARGHGDAAARLAEVVRKSAG